MKGFSRFKINCPDCQKPLSVMLYWNRDLTKEERKHITYSRTNWYYCNKCDNAHKMGFSSDNKEGIKNE
tara:strand:- start:38 stop:244 length:207 start_codon:yes stop_codon:yes gene_type:complete